MSTFVFFHFFKNLTFNADSITQFTIKKKTQQKCTNNFYSFTPLNDMIMFTEIIWFLFVNKQETLKKKTVVFGNLWTILYRTGRCPTCCFILYYKYQKKKNVDFCVSHWTQTRITLQCIYIHTLAGPAPVRCSTLAP